METQGCPDFDGARFLDWSSATIGEIVHVDGGSYTTGAELVREPKHNAHTGDRHGTIADESV